MKLRKKIGIRKIKKILCLFVMACLIGGMFHEIPVEAASKNANIVFDACIYDKKYQLSIFYYGKEKLKKVEYKKGKITSTKNSKWKNATNVTKKFSPAEDMEEKRCFYSSFMFKKSGNITFRFITNKNKKYVKTLYVNLNPKTISGKQTLTGKVKIAKWKHPGNGLSLKTYVLQLSSPKNIKVRDSFDDTKVIFCNQERVQLTTIENNSIHLKKYVGKTVKVKGRLWGGAGTCYYFENVSFDVISIKKK